MNITAEVVRRYPFESTANIAKDLGVSLSKIYNRAWSLGIKKDPVYLRSTQYPKGYLGGKASQFKPGHIPKNKGVKMPAELYNVIAPTMFKKGNKPHNFRPVGSERLTKDGYVERKIANPKTWKGVHVLVWEAAHGPVPAKHKVIFKDNNKLNNELSNLECVSYADAMRRNSIVRYPADLRFAMKTLKKLKKQINNGKEQN